MRVQLLGRSRRRSAAVCAAVALFGCACSTASSVKSSDTRGTVVAVGAENEYANVIAQIGGKYVEVTAITEQSQHRSPQLRGEPVGRQPRQLSPPDRPERRRLRHLHEHHRGRIAEFEPQGGRRPEAPRAPGQHVEPAPLVQPAHDAGRGEGDRKRPVGSGCRPRRLLRGQAGGLRSLAGPLAQGPLAVQGQPSRDTGGDDRAGGRLHAPSGGSGQQDPLHVPGRHHERRRPGAREHHLRREPAHRSQGEGLLVQRAGDGSITESLLGLAKKHGIPVVGVYETMPTPGYDYQTWMLAEVRALDRAVSDKISTERL